MTRRARRAATPVAPDGKGGTPGALQGLAQWIRPRRWRLIGLSLGMLCLYLVWIVETHATRSAGRLGLIITVVALVGLIGAGNALEAWMGIRHRSPQYTERERHKEDEAAP